MSVDVNGASDVAITGRRTPMVLSVARRLRESGDGAPAVDRPVTVRLSSTTDAQQANLTFTAGGITVCADAVGEPDLDWKVAWVDPVASSEDVDGAPEPLRLVAKEVQVRLASDVAPWATCVQDFWDRTHSLAGMPASLRVVCTDAPGAGDSELMLGDVSVGPAAFEIHATETSLSRLFGGRALVMEELETGEMAINGGLADLSALVGASLKVVCGER